MPNHTAHQNHEPGHRVRTDESQQSHDRGLVVLLWLLALLLAEIEFWTLAFAHMYSM